MKYVMILSALVALSACVVEEGDNVTENFTSVCIDNVQYWHRAIGHKGYITPRIDPVTLSFVNCEN